LGEEVWERLIGLHVVLVGCGRTGSVMAVSLTRLGIRRLTLIDPDCVELHNLGEMDALTEADLGTPKAEALARHLFSLSSPGRISILPLNASIAHPTALSAAKAGDVLVCCADNDAARLATGLIATLYHKVLLDIGTGIFLEDSRQPPAGSGQPSPIRIPNSGTLRVFRIRTMGADVRLIIPGDGCLLCRGNLTAYSQAVEDLCNHRPPARVPGEWRQERAGSLRSLNVMAAGLGVHMLQELVSERIDQSAWAHLEFDQAGQLTVQYPPFPRSNDSAPCALCVKAGLGNEGFWWARQGGDPEFPEANLE
jgi:molybdopterin/thiamine biosynthesis adenylyltransferase